MADPRRRAEGNVPGRWFVDTSCIDCDACRQIAPGLFGSNGASSVVVRQPRPDEEVDAVRALVACPVGAIGVAEGAVELADDLFPQPLDAAAGVFYCGFNASSSYGANSFFVRRPEGNVLVDAPRWARRLVAALERAGGLADILLTHRDDVADARRYQEHFGARLWIHEADRRAAPTATDLLRGEAVRAIRPSLLAIPLPGHTRGSVAYLLDETFLFTGDSLYWSRERGRLAASSRYCWYSWDEQLRSLRRLADFRWEWVLAGHGDRVRLPAAVLRRQLEELVVREAS